MSDDDVTLTSNVFGKRYGEVLLVRAGKSGPEATVYNTFPSTTARPNYGRDSMHKPSRRRMARSPHCSTDGGIG